MTETQLLLVLSVMNINIINYKTVVQQQITRNSIKKRNLETEVCSSYINCSDRVMRKNKRNQHNTVTITICRH